jgi:hypothetical protein
MLIACTWLSLTCNPLFKNYFLGQGGEMTQALYAHMNNKTIKIKIKKKRTASISI